MKKMTKVISLALALVMCLALCACGQKDSGDTAADGKKTFIMGVDPEYPPFSYLDADGQPTGIDVALAREAFSRMGYRPEFVPVDWVEKTHLLDSGAVDCLWSSFTMTDREDDYHWAGPYMLSRQVVAVMPGSEIQTLADLAGKTVAVQATTKPESLFLNHTDPRIPEVRALLTVQNRELIFSYLSKGYVDAIAAHEISIVQFMQDYGLEYRILDEPLQVVGLGVAFARSDTRGLDTELNAVLAEMRADGRHNHSGLQR